MVDLERIYRESLDACAPDHLVRKVARADMPPNLVAIGKCAGALLDGFAGIVPTHETIAAIPRGYPAPRVRSHVVWGGHPSMDDGSFRAGGALIEFVERHSDITFLISGGGSACADVPLRPHFREEDLIATNTRLTSAGIPIADINTVRKQLSAIKGGRLGARVKGRSVTLVYSDVATGDLASVASGPTLPDGSTRDEAIAVLERVGGCDRIVTTLRDLSVPETVQRIANAEAMLVADNATLVDAAGSVAARFGLRIVRIEQQIESDVAIAARDLAQHALRLREGEVLVAGGEPTVRVRGNGRGGRCLEMGVRFTTEMSALDPSAQMRALFASSDGVDGNSGVAGIAIDLPVAYDRARIESALASSDSLAATVTLGRPIIIPATGNNLRDLYLVARA